MTNWTPNDYGYHPAFVPSYGVDASAVTDLTGSKIPTTRGKYTAPPTSANVPEAAAAQVANVLSNPNAIRKVPADDANITKNWLQRLFDTTDAAETPVESVWDGMLKGVGWFYDRLSQAETTAISSLPGGIPTLTWDQANKISPGQAAIGSVIYDYNALTGNAGDFDILDENHRKAAFEQNAIGKMASGGVDIGLALFADPFFIAGKAAKVTRLRYLDKMYTSPEELSALSTRISDDLVKWDAAGRTEEAVAELHPVTSAIIWATAKTPEGTPLRSAQEFAKHQVFKQADDFEGLTSAMLLADTPEQGALAVRLALGDLSVLPTLRKQRMDLVAEIQAAHRKALETQLMFRPQQQKVLLEKYTKRADSAWEEYQYVLDRRVEVGAAVNEPLEEFAYQQFDQALENKRLVANFELPDPALVRTPAETEAAKLAFKDAHDALRVARERDKFFQKALADEESNVGGFYKTLANKQKGFSSDTAFGRAAEASRQKRATIGYREAATKRALASDGSRLKGWERDVFGTKGSSRLIHMWRWTGDEVPSGRIGLLGEASQGSSKELMAVLNDISIYSGEAKKVKYTVSEVVRDSAGNVMKDSSGKAIRREVEKEKLVGGVQRKDEILRQYIQASGDSATDVVARKRLIDGLERAIARDLGDWHGMDQFDVSTMIRKAQSERESLVKFIKEKKYWVDEKGQHASPFLDSHLENGTYLTNFHAVEKAIQQHMTTSKFALTKAYTADRVEDIYQSFNEVWRPATLLRLGYTQRNVMEGLIRATAFTFATNPHAVAVPMMDALRATGLGVKNLKAGRVVEREAVKVERLGAGASKRFTTWHENAKKAAAAEVQRIESEVEVFKTAVARAKAEGDEAGLLAAQKNLQYNTNLLDGARFSVHAIEDEGIALIKFREQGKNKMRLYSGESVSDGLNPVLMRQAFNDRNGVAQIMWGNMSSDATRKLESMLAADGVSHLFMERVTKEFVTVNPNEGRAYFDGVAKVLMQYKNSAVGEMIINGADPRDIAIFLRKNPTGREIAEFIGKASADKNGFRIISMKDADEYVAELTRRYQTIAPSEELRTLLRSSKHVTGEQVEKFLKGRPDLKPVVGNHAADVGTRGLLGTYKALSHVLFRALGTLPEDALVRGPFYGRRYEVIRDDMVKSYQQQMTAMGRSTEMTVKDINIIHKNAHSAALADTKKWLYTIERRTNLGQIGEHIFPFISATQNSVTTFGKLIWTDPRIGTALVKMWQAPQKMGWEDEQGNILLPLPHELIPDGLEQAVGIDNMMNMKVSKNGLNVIFPISGETPIPSPGPLVVAPASEIMKHGWFGQSIDAPSLMKSALGEKVANDIWDQWKSYLFGQGQGVSDKTLSYDVLLPPWVQKAIQMKDGELNSTAYAHQYSLQLRTEQAKYVAGYRDTPPTADEIKKRTNGLFMLRILGNLTAFTPPQYTSKLEPLINAIKFNERTYGTDASRMNSDQFGDYLLMLGDAGASKNVSGALPSVNAYSNARKYSDLIERVSPEVQDNLSVLGIILNNNSAGDTSAMYDPSVYAWQTATNIPGLARKFREMQSPQQALIESQKSAGWVAFSKGMDMIDAVRQQRGLKSLRVAGAKDLAAMKVAMIERLANDPSFAGWYDDYVNFGSSRTANAIEVMTAALNDPKFMADNGDNSVWQSAKVYLQARQQYVNDLIDSDEWDYIRGQLVDGSTAWAAIANRYLNSDDDPKSVGVSFATMGVTNG